VYGVRDTTARRQEGNLNGNMDVHSGLLLAPLALQMKCNSLHHYIALLSRTLQIAVWKHSFSHTLGLL
jgi:uncharacterized integral membrane protein